MRLALVLAALLLGIPSAAPQSPGVLHIRIVLTDPSGQATPVSRHMLLISDNPATAPPREVVTKADGTADVKLPPGNYTVESDRPAMFQGKAYQWRQMLDVRADREAVLELTLGNAEVASAPSGSSMSAAPAEFDRSALLAQWQDSVVALWTPTRRATGFLFDARGLIATNQRVIGAATTAVEVQISPEVKVAARVLASDPARNVTVLWIDPGVIAAVRPVPLGCGDATQPPVAKGQKLFTIGAPLRDPKGVTPGTVSIVSLQSIVADFILARDTGLRR
jgi:S1-C subfamily serine protease